MGRKPQHDACLNVRFGISMRKAASPLSAKFDCPRQWRFWLAQRGSLLRTNRQQ
jgi:hypothetical protein